MDSAIVSAMAAVLGSLVRGAATFATTWVTQRTLSKRELVAGEIRTRETLSRMLQTRRRLVRTHTGQAGDVVAGVRAAQSYSALRIRRGA